MIDRRAFLAHLGAVATAAAAGFRAGGAAAAEFGAEHLTARVVPPTGSVAAGLHPLGLGDGARGRDGLLYVPAAGAPERPRPLVVLLHGAGGSAADWFGSYAARADAAGFILLAPDSRDSTWDGSRQDAFGTDVPFIDRALGATFTRCAVDPGKIALAGFSDGASYALSLGLANGDLVSRVVAFSPGYVVETTRRGLPRLFVSHGTADAVLAIDRTGRAFARRFRRDGYRVEWAEFPGGHEVPRAISDRAFAWLREGWDR